ncbi:hypothetical protein V491_04412, partial [Pseudogymnoascus sp. VKM F-3775]
MNTLLPAAPETAFTPRLGNTGNLTALVAVRDRAAQRNPGSGLHEPVSDCVAAIRRTSRRPGFHSATPVIVDEAYESPETVTLRYEEACAGGPVGRSDSLSGFLPMSAFGKPPPPHLQGFDTNRSFSDPTYAYSAAPQHASQPPPHASPFQNAPEMAQVSYGSHATRGSYDEQAGSYAP